MESVLTRMVVPCLSLNNPAPKPKPSNPQEDLNFTDIDFTDISSPDIVGEDTISLTDTDSEMVDPHSSGISGVSSELVSTVSCPDQSGAVLVKESRGTSSLNDIEPSRESHSLRVSDSSPQTVSRSQKGQANSPQKEQKKKSKKQLEKEKRLDSILAKQDKIYEKAQMKYQLKVKTTQVKVGLKKIKKSKKLPPSEQATSEEKIKKIQKEVNLLRKKSECKEIKKTLLGNSNKKGFLSKVFRRYQCGKLEEKKAAIEKQISHLLEEAEGLKEMVEKEKSNPSESGQAKGKDGAGEQSKDDKRTALFKLFISDTTDQQSAATSVAAH